MTVANDNEFRVLQYLVNENPECQELYYHSNEMAEGLEIPHVDAKNAISDLKSKGCVKCMKDNRDGLNVALLWTGKRIYVQELHTPQYRSSTGNPTVTQKVFIVHGRDEASREKVARFIEKLELQAIILQEQPGKGRTIIEKFTECADDVAYAIVLLTGDDVGRLANANDQVLKPRARQNVIFELGYFLAKLGRNRVCALYERGVECPSDFGSVEYVSLEGDWELKVAKEMKAARLAIDLNKLC